jgi:flagellar M-ring protein FliF
MSILSNLSTRQRIIIGVAIVAAGAGIYAMVQWKHEGDFRPLFTGLAPEDAAGIVQKLKEAGVEYRLPEAGGAVLVPSARLAELRISMAAVGLPKTGRLGFELFDKANLGATEFTEHVNYRRAVEGELERSVMTLAEVEQARVHITFPKDSVFLESQQPAKASVLVKIRSGSRLSPQNVQAIDHLVASAVEGLSPDAVSVLDMNGNLLGRPKAVGTLDGPEASEAGLDYRHKIEADLLAKIDSTLEPLLGPEKFKAGVSVECDFTAGDLSEETFDPSKSVMVSSQKTEDSSAGAGGTGVPGTPSTLPRPTPRPGAGTSATHVNRMTESIQYQSSRTVKKTRLPSGGLRKMSLAVLIDQAVTWQRDGSGFRKILVPPAPEKLKAIHDVVAGITGFNEQRGDQLVIETLPFESTLLLEPPPSPNPAVPGKPAMPQQWRFQLDRKTILIASGAGVVLVALAVLLIRRRGKKTRAKAPTVAAAVAGPEEARQTALLPGATVAQQLEAKLAERDALQEQMNLQALNSLTLAPPITKTAEIMAKHLREKIKQDPEVSAQILRTWIREEEV